MNALLKKIKRYAVAVCGGFIAGVVTISAAILCFVKRTDGSNKGEQQDSSGTDRSAESNYPRRRRTNETAESAVDKARKANKTVEDILADIAGSDADAERGTDSEGNIG